MHMYVKYEGSLISHIDRRVKNNKNEKWLPLKNIVHIDQIFHVDILETYVHVYARYKIFVIKAVARSTVRRW